MLRLIPRYPQKIKAGDLLQKLELEGFNISKRTVERDLNELSTYFPLALDDRDRPYGWSWQKDAAAFDLPGISTNEALTLVMVEQHLKNLLPNTTIDVLQPYFKRAHNFLDESQSAQRVKSWLDKVRTVQPNQTLLAPFINEEVHQVISEALLYEKQVEIQYKRRREHKFAVYRIHPLALIQRGGIIYLLVRFFDYEEIKIIALHRIQTAKLLDMAAIAPGDFDVDREIAKGRLDFGDGEVITLKALFNAEIGEHLYESPLNKNQSIELMDDGKMLISANVIDTPQLRWWLSGFADGVEVLEPLLLREEISAVLRDTYLKYHSE